MKLRDGVRISALFLFVLILGLSLNGMLPEPGWPLHYSIHATDNYVALSTAMGVGYVISTIFNSNKRKASAR